MPASESESVNGILFCSARKRVVAKNREGRGHNNITMRTRGLQAIRIARSSNLGSFFFLQFKAWRNFLPRFLMAGFA
jgi:hypothetical protein